MKITKLNCTSCGAPISVPDGINYINCSSCGSFLAIERGEGYIALKIAEKITQVITDSSRNTQEVIRENTVVTRSELQRLQLSNEVSTAKMKLNFLQTEIRSLERESTNLKKSFQLKNLHTEEFLTLDQIRLLEYKMTVPEQNNLETSIKFFRQELEWIDSELQL